MICPVCKRDMMVVEYRNIELDYCNSCKGVWFDSGELELFLKSRGLEEPKVLLGGILASAEAASPEKRRRCPICGRKMKKAAIGRQGEVLIDVCRDEHGLWFDAGEVTRLMQSLAGECLPKHDSEGQVISFIGEVFRGPC